VRVPPEAQAWRSNAEQREEAARWRMCASGASSGSSVAPTRRVPHCRVPIGLPSAAIETKATNAGSDSRILSLLTAKDAWTDDDDEFMVSESPNETAQSCSSLGTTGVASSTPPCGTPPPLGLPVLEAWPSASDDQQPLQKAPPTKPAPTPLSRACSGPASFEVATNSGKAPPPSVSALESTAEPPRVKRQPSEVKPPPPGFEAAKVKGPPPGVAGTVARRGCGCSAPFEVKPPPPGFEAAGTSGPSSLHSSISASLQDTKPPPAMKEFKAPPAALDKSMEIAPIKAPPTKPGAVTSIVQPPIGPPSAADGVLLRAMREMPMAPVKSPSVGKAAGPGAGSFVLETKPASEYKEPPPKLTMGFKDSPFLAKGPLVLGKGPPIVEMLTKASPSLQAVGSAACPRPIEKTPPPCTAPIGNSSVPSEHTPFGVGGAPQILAVGPPEARTVPDSSLMFGTTPQEHPLSPEILSPRRQGLDVNAQEFHPRILLAPTSEFTSSHSQMSLGVPSSQQPWEHLDHRHVVAPHFSVGGQRSALIGNGMEILAPSQPVQAQAAKSDEKAQDLSQLEHGKQDIHLGCTLGSNPAFHPLLDRMDFLGTENLVDQKDPVVPVTAHGQISGGFLHEKTIGFGPGMIARRSVHDPGMPQPSVSLLHASRDPPAHSLAGIPARDTMLEPPGQTPSLSQRDNLLSRSLKLPSAPGTPVHAPVISAPTSVSEPASDPASQWQPPSTQGLAILRDGWPLDSPSWAQQNTTTPSTLDEERPDQIQIPALQADCAVQQSEDQSLGAPRPSTASLAATGGSSAHVADSGYANAVATGEAPANVCENHRDPAPGSSAQSNVQKLSNEDTAGASDTTVSDPAVAYRTSAWQDVQAKIGPAPPGLAPSSPPHSLTSANSMDPGVEGAGEIVAGDGRSSQSGMGQVATPADDAEDAELSVGDPQDDQRPDFSSFSSCASPSRDGSSSSGLLPKPEASLETTGAHNPPMHPQEERQVLQEELIRSQLRIEELEGCLQEVLESNALHSAMQERLQNCLSNIGVCLQGKSQRG